MCNGDGTVDDDHGGGGDCDDGEDDDDNTGGGGNDHDSDSIYDTISLFSWATSCSSSCGGGEMVSYILSPS